MYVDKSSVKQKNGTLSYRYLLRESYRANGKTKHRTVGSLSRCSKEEIEAIKLALKYKGNLTLLKPYEGKIHSTQGLSVGTIVLLKAIAQRLKIQEALGNSRQGQLALWQIMARAMDQGSRLSAVRLAGQHAICDLIALERFDEDDLYENLDWLSDHQREIERKLFELRTEGKAKPKLYLYDVTSSYLEGVNNELGDWGYNRDQKRGKKQIVIGLLTDEEGAPLSVEVFKGNTNDLKTFLSQVKKLAHDFGVTEVTMVGDRGMIKSEQIKDLGAQQFHYITALSKPQMETLIGNNVIEMELFDEKLCEVEQENVRYILRRNPVRVEELDENRRSKIGKIQDQISGQNQYLAEHPKASVEVAQRKMQKLIGKLKLNDFVGVTIQGRTLSFQQDSEKKAEKTLLDGCYVIKTDLKREQISCEVVHQRYKDLAMVEQGFRTMKTGLLETRPIYVQKEKRTRGHVFVVMLAYCIVRELKKLWKEINITVEEGMNELNSVCGIDMSIRGSYCRHIPEPRQLGQKLLRAAQVVLPEVLPHRGVVVATRKKLVGQRK